jgi:hypothetical protein
MEARANRAEVKLVSHRQQRSLSRDCRGDVAGAREVAEGGEVMEWFAVFLAGFSVLACAIGALVGYRDGYREGRESGKTVGWGRAMVLRERIADEVIAERQKQRQEHVRQQMACACDRVDRWSEKND